jgi:hypothetical protein
MAMVAEGDSADLIRRYRLGKVVNPLELDDIADAIKEYFRMYRSGGLAEPGPAPVDFTREELAGRFSKILRGIEA